MYLSSANNTQQETDLTDRGHLGVVRNGASLTTLPNGDFAKMLNGIDQYIEVADKEDLSVQNQGVLTVEAWIRPDAVDFVRTESPNQPYIWFAGKMGQASGDSEYGMRMYSRDADWSSDGIVPPRPNRISGYAFNLNGGLGAGSYFQDAVVGGVWIHYVFVVNTLDVSAAYPTGYTKIYKNGQLRGQSSLAQYSIVPAHGNAPFRIGSTTLHSFFQGAIGKVAVYSYELPAAVVQKHYVTMMR